MNIKLTLITLGATALIAMGDLHGSTPATPATTRDLLTRLPGYDFNCLSGVYLSDWTQRLLNATTGVEIKTGAVAWWDDYNYPSRATDPLSNLKGAAAVEVDDSDFAGKVSEGDWLALQFISPDLTDCIPWQTGTGFSACLTCASDAPHYPDIYGNLLVIIEDQVGKLRYFYNHEASILTRGEWDTQTWQFDFSDAKPAVGDDYTVKHVVIQFFIDRSSGLWGGDPICPLIDNVFPSE